MLQRPLGVPLSSGRTPQLPSVGLRRPVARGSAPHRAFVDNKSPGPVTSVSTQAPSSPATDLIVLDYEDLVAGKDLGARIEQAYGPDGLGALVVRNVPGYPALRQHLLHLAHDLAALPDPVKEGLEDPASHYSVGWSRGKESLENGQPDTNKGSFYANPLVDDLLAPRPGDQLQPWSHPLLPHAVTHGSAQQGPAAARAGSSAAGSGSSGRSAAELQALRERYPGYYRPNVWPASELPELEGAFKDLGRLVVAVGCLLAQHCDSYVSSRLGLQPGQLAGVLHRSRNPKARLLHYYAPDALAPQQAPGPQQGGAQDPQPQQQADPHSQPWCGWHSDHGSLTGLTSAMYLDASGREVPCPDPSAGLYIEDRHRRVVRAAIPPDCIAFQVGEALQVQSGGLLRATPHYVRAATGPAAAGVSRNTFAVFMQPEVDEPMACPPGVDPAQVAIGRWRPGHTFGEFAEETFKQYYKAEGGQEGAGEEAARR